MILVIYAALVIFKMIQLRTNVQEDGADRGTGRIKESLEKLGGYK